MSVTSASYSAMVIDSNIAVWAVLPSLPTTAFQTLDWLMGLDFSGVVPVVPAFWTAECVSAIRQAVYRRDVSAAIAYQATEDLFALNISVQPLTLDLCHSALDWAQRLQQSKPYDAFYLALAESLDVELWTADRRFANGAQQLGASFVHWIGEAIK